MPGQPAFGGGLTETALSPVVLVGLLIVLLLTLVLPRKYVIVPLLMGIFLIPLGEQVYALGVHWLVYRIIVLGGLVRVALVKTTSSTSFAGGFNPVDSAFFICVIVESVAVVLLYMQMPALINQVGFLIDFLGAYCVLRVVIQNEEDIYLALRCMGVLAAILGAGMIREQMTLQNAFGLLGGVPLASQIRGDSIRSQAVFQHPLTAGAVGGTLVPLFLLLWRQRRSRPFAAAGLLGCTAMTLCANSSTPMLAYFAGPFALCFWPIRKRMKQVLWGFVVLLVALHMVMKAPVWMLIARVDLTGSSSGYHRAQLVDQFITHFSDWWLVGTKDAVNWGEDIWDAQNEYVSVGENGGLLAFSFFIIMIARAFDRLKQARKLAEDRSREWYFWLLSAALFSNLVAFFGVNYYDQSKASWFLLLAIISAATVPALPQAVASKAAGLATRNGLTSWQPKRPRLEKSQFQSI